MDTPIFCVYNLARRAFLSSKVTVADAVNQPLKVLKDLVALDGESGLWLTTLLGRPSLPKLFPYDLAYLDKDLRVVETIEVLPGIDFPAHRREVTSAVVLAPDTLRKTQTRAGDHLVVCRQEELDRLLAGMGEPVQGSPPKNERIASLEKAASVGTGGASTICEDVPGALAETAVHVGSLPLTAKPAAATLVAAITEKEPADLAATVKMPSVSITEVVIEKPHDFDHQIQPTVEHRAGLEDLFANWVDSPSAPPSWIAQKARERELKAPPAVGDSVSHKDPAGEAEKTEAMTAGNPSAAEPQEPAALRPAPNPSPVDRPSPAPTAPIATQIPQRPQTTTFTIGQHGIWQLSSPTAMSPKRPGSNGSGQVPSKGPTGSKPDESPKPQNQGPLRRTGDVRTSPPLKPRQTQSPDAPAKAPPAAETTPVEKPIVAPAAAPISEKLQAVQPEAMEPEVKATPPIPATQVPPRKVESPPSTSTPPRWSLSNKTGTSSPVASSESKPAASPGDKVVEAVKPTASNFASTIQERLEKLQTTMAPTGVPNPTPVAAAEKKIFAANPQPASKAGLPPVAPGKPAEKPEDRKAAAEQHHELAVTLPLPSFLKPKPDQKEKLKISIQRVESNGKDGSQPDGFGARLKRWLKPTPATKSDRRRAHRRYVPGMVAHFFTGGTPRPHDVADISMTGFYLLTEERWIPETIVRMTLQKPCARGERKQSITVLARIIRRGTDGVGAEFVMQESLRSNTRDILPTHATDRFSLARFL
ncbi:MAG TPA: PilZ domain-containing protein [Terracidiphilus sp.]|jgi:hypothetical protein